MVLSAVKSQSSTQVYDERSAVLMLPLTASTSSHSTSKPVIIYCLIAAIHVVLNKGVILLYPHTSTILLLQLAVGAGLARVYGAYRGRAASFNHVGAIEAAPLVGSLSLALLAGLHALAQGATVDQLVVFSTCTPVAVALADRLFLGRAAPDWFLYALVLILSAWASSMQLLSLAPLAFACLGLYFLCMVFYCIYSSYYSRTVKQTSMERVYIENLLSCLPCLAVTMICDLSHGWELLHLTPLSSMMLALSTITYFLSSYFGWEVRTATATTSTGYAAVGSCSGLVSLAPNYSVWDKHGPPWPNMVSAAAILLIGLAQHPQRQHKHRHQQRVGSKGGEEGLQNPAAYAVGILAAAAAVVGVLWLGASLGAVDTRDSSSLLVGTRQQFEQEMQLIGQELATLKHKAADWESNLVHRYTAVAGVGAVHPRNSSSSSIGLVHDIRGGSNSSSTGSPTTTTAHVTAAAAGQPPDPAGYQQRLKGAASKPINIVVMTGLFWSLNPKQTENCTVDGVPLDCHITADQSHADSADALYYHIPSFSGVPRAKAFPNQLRIAMSLESAVYYTNLDNPGFMCGFDAEMTYRHCSQVVNWYSLENFKNLFAVSYELDFVSITTWAEVRWET
eukprot:GHUV01034488.1.p1 GENE.GHUV01034488.1~~GHUV01034488.1.p1  ORF type:complete len:620 (+),score=105.70 GHUV01034488.1:566-2425(+)